MRALPTLGGNNGFATGANNRGEVVGWAENTCHDPLCVPPQVLQFRPVIYGPGENQIRELPLIAGDSSKARLQRLMIAGTPSVSRAFAIRPWEDIRPFTP